MSKRTYTMANFARTLFLLGLVYGVAASLSAEELSGNDMKSLDGQVQEINPMS